MQFYYGLLEELPSAVATVNQWYGNLSEPIRRRALATAIVAGSCFFTPTPTATITVAPDKWNQALSEPQRPAYRGLATFEQQSVAFVKASPFPETVSADRFHIQHSEPVRRKGLGVNEQQSTAFVNLPDHIPGWQFATSQPTLRRGLPTAEQQTAAFVAPLVISGWEQPLSQPVLRRGLATAQQQSAAFIGAAPFAETVSADRWAYSTSQPTPRSRPGIPAGEQQWIVYDEADPFPETVSADRWAFAISQPTYAKRRVYPDSVSIPGIDAPVGFYGVYPDRLDRRQLATAQQQAATYIGADPFPETVSADRWAYDTSQPTLAKRRVQPDNVYYGYYVAPSAEVVTADKWYVELSTPQRSRAGLPVREQQSSAYIGASPFPEYVSADRFVFQTSQPTYAKRRIQPDGAAPTVTVSFSPDWLFATSQPTLRKRQVQPDGVSAVAQFSTAELVTIDKWYSPLSEPSVKYRRSVATSAQQSIVYAAAEAVTADRWLQEISQPARRVVSRASLSFTWSDPYPRPTVYFIGAIYPDRVAARKYPVTQQPAVVYPAALPAATTIGAGYLAVYPDWINRKILAVSQQQSVVFAPAILQERGRSLICASLSVYAAVTVTVTIEPSIGATPSTATSVSATATIEPGIDATPEASAAVSGTPSGQTAVGGTPETKDC